jgi:RNA polymerase sigma-70 factor (ECF subfamily)
MIRITAVSNDRSVTFRFEGRLTEGSLARLSDTEEMRDLGARCLLDLSGLQYADHAGAAFLRELIQGGAQVVGCTDFLRELIAIDSRENEHGCADAERQFVERLRAGDEGAFEELVRRHGPRMLSVARRFLGSEEDARDAVQDAFAAVFESIGRFKGGAMLSTWLHRIVVNAALMQLRRRRRKPEHSIDELLPSFKAEGSWSNDYSPACTTSHAILEQRETRKLVRQCIAALPEPYLAILLLRDIEQLETAETAERLGIAPSAVKVRLHRARQALGTILERKAETASDASVRRPKTRIMKAA